MSESKICRDCSASFEFTEGEAAFYQGKGLRPPQRCKDCRKKRKLQRAQQFVAQEVNSEQFPEAGSF